MKLRKALFYTDKITFYDDYTMTLDLTTLRGTQTRDKWTLENGRVVCSQFVEGSRASDEAQEAYSNWLSNLIVGRGGSHADQIQQ